MFRWVMLAVIPTLVLILLVICIILLLREVLVVGPRSILPDPIAEQGLPSTDPLYEIQCPNSSGTRLTSVADFSGTGAFEESFADAHGATTVRIRWRPYDELKALFMRPYSSIAGQSDLGDSSQCTGTLISETLILTAAHCVAVSDGSDPRKPRQTPHEELTNSIEHYAPPSLVARAMVAELGYEKSSPNASPNPQAIASIIGIREFDPRLDYAILEVEEGAFAVQVEPAVFASEPVFNGQPLAIIQHPKGAWKHIATGNARRNPTGENHQSGPNVGGANASSIFYANIETRDGSSGAAIRNDQGEIVGIHTNGGCKDKGIDANSGVSILAIAAVSDEISTR